MLLNTLQTELYTHDTTDGVGGFNFSNTFYS